MLVSPASVLFTLAAFAAAALPTARAAGAPGDDPFFGVHSPSALVRRSRQHHSSSYHRRVPIPEPAPVAVPVQISSPSTPGTPQRRSHDDGPLMPQRRSHEPQAERGEFKRSTSSSSPPTRRRVVARSPGGACPTVGLSANVTLSSASVPAPTATPILESDNGILTITTVELNTMLTTVTVDPATPTSTAVVSQPVVIPSSTPVTDGTVDPDGVGPFSGAGTWFKDSHNACGKAIQPSDKVVAVSAALFDSWPGFDSANPTANPICGRKLAVTLASSPSSTPVEVTVADRCPTCQSERDLDFTSSVFASLVPGGVDVGRVAVTWSWIN